MLPIWLLMGMPIHSLFFVKVDGETEITEKGQLNEREISGIQAFIKKHYREMYLKWSEMSNAGFYEGK